MPTHSDRPLNPQENDQNALRKKVNEHRLEGGDLDIEAAKMDEDDDMLRLPDLGETIMADQTTSQLKSKNADLNTVEMIESKVEELSDNLLQIKVRSDMDSSRVQTNQELGKVEIFFDTTWNNFVRKFRWPIVIIGLLMGVYAGHRSSEIRGLTSMEQYTPYDHYVMVAFRKILFGFNEGDQAQTIVVDIMWGVEGINKTNVDYFNASDIGRATWDKEFDLSLS